MNVWRIQLKPDSEMGIDPRKHCLNNEIVGIGWQVQPVPQTPEECWKLVENRYRYISPRSWRAAFNAILWHIQIGDLIWTRDWSGNYFLGRILGNWYYDSSEDCAKADIVNVRKCDWRKIGTVAAVPGKVVNSFRAARTVQKINDDTIRLFSQITYNQKTETSFYTVDNLVGKDIFSLLLPDDCEDALGIYLQIVYGYYIIPSSCKKDTVKYEFELKHQKTGKSALAQVKSGLITLNRDEYSSDTNDTDTIFLFATSGQYDGTPNPKIITIDPNKIRDFLYEYTHLLPDKMCLWIKKTR